MHKRGTGISNHKQTNKKCGLFPFNPSTVDNRKLAPSKAFRATPILTRKVSMGESAGESNDEPGSPIFSKEQESLYSKTCRGSRGLRSG